jgi:hypothetical protein
MYIDGREGGSVVKKWEYKVVCYRYHDSKSCWVSVFDNRESRTLEELISSLGDEGWELVNVAPELAFPIDYPSPSPAYSPGPPARAGGMFEKIRAAGGENTHSAPVPMSLASGGFDVKTYRAFFKRKKGLFG